MRGGAAGRRAYGGFALRLRTVQGYPLAVGGLCPAGTEAAWRERLGAMSRLVIEDRDLVAIDRALASRLAQLCDRSIPAAGASIQVDAAFPAGVRTGGVLGCPWEEIASSSGEEETLPEGASLCTLPGGPGLLAMADRTAVRQAFREICALGRIDTAAFLQCLRSAGISTGMLVFDGTGGDAAGYVLTVAGGTWEAAAL